MSDPSGGPAIDANAIRILVIRLAACHFAINPEFAASGERTIKFEYRYSLERLSAPDERGVVRLGIAAFEDVEDPPFRVRIEYEGWFAAEPGHEAGLREYMRYNALATLIPYLRETLTSITARAGYQPLVLPPINAVTLADELDAADVSDSAVPDA